VVESGPSVTAPTIGPFLSHTRIAYFSMEIAIRPEIKTYSGGLGLLAGDTARSCADLELPVVFVSLVSRKGYLRQEIDAAGRQVEHPDPWEPAQYATPLRAKVAVPIAGREVWVRPWLLVQHSPLGRRVHVPVLLLDTQLEENHPEDRGITDTLYGGDRAYRLKQEMVLGIAGVRILQALGFTIGRYHLNEGHAALLALDLLRRYPRPDGPVAMGEVGHDVAQVREMCIFTTHTPVEAGHDRFPYDLVRKLMPDYMKFEQLKPLAGESDMNMTRLAINLSGYVNGVAVRHAETTVRMFPGYRVRAVTNGVHLGTWAHPRFAALFDRACPAWGIEPETLVRADRLGDAEVWDAHLAAKAELLAAVAARTGCAMDPALPVIGFARRMTGYKRPAFLFADLARLRAIHKTRPFQVVIAGKAHPHDESGKRAIQAIHGHIAELRGEMRVAFLPDYDMALARRMVAGVDVWLNTPVPPMEASGTSGMKAALNGVLNLSVLDGWWVEACMEGVTGWAIGHEGGTGPVEVTEADLYRKLEQVVLPQWYDDRAQWLWMMKQAISKIGSYFNTQRMMRRYAAEAYVV
jgi:starch phosphorylase